MGTWVYDIDCCVRDLRVSEERLAVMKRSWRDVADWRERPLGGGTVAIDPVCADGSRLFTEAQPWSFEQDAAELVAECEPSSVIDLYASDDFAFVRIRKTEEGDVTTEWRWAMNPFEAQPA